MNIKTTLLAALLASAAAPAARATLYYHIDGESGGVITTGSASYTATGSITVSNPDYTRNYSLPTYTLTQANNANGVEQDTLNKFGFVVNPDGDYDAPLVVSSGGVTPFRGSGYLQFGYPAFQHPNGSGRSSPPGNQTAQGLSTDAADKCMIAFAPHYNPAPGNPNYNPNWNPAAVQRRDIGRYVGFALYIPDAGAMPVENTRWTILYQCFQLGSGGRPPFAVTITRARTGQSAPQTDGKVEIAFGFRDSDAADSPQQTASDDIQSTTYFRTKELDRGVWYSFVIYQKPSSDPAVGEAKVWVAKGSLPPFTSPRLNDYLVFNFSGKWGYPNPRATGGTPDPDRDLFSGQLGLYSNDIASKAARMHFDEIKFADTYDEANPAAVPASRKPIVTAFDSGATSPNLVVADGGVTITGSNFTEPVEVWFDTTPAVCTRLSATELVAFAPAGAAFTGRLSVHCSGWAADAPQAYRFASAPEELLLLNDTQTVAAGHSLSLAAAAVISDLPIDEFTWQYSTDNGRTWLNAVGSNYTTSGSGVILHINNIGGALDNYRYRYLAASTAGIAYSNSLKLAVSTPPFRQPVALAFDTAGALHVAGADASARLVLSDVTSGYGTDLINGALTLAGAATLVSAEREVALSGSGVPRLAGLAADALYKLTFTGGTAAAAAPETAAQATAPLAANPALTAAALLSGTVGITAADTGNNFYYTNPDDHTIRIRAAGGETLVLAGTPGVAGLSDGTGTNGTLFDTPFAITLAPDGSALYVADTGNALIRKITFPTANFAEARVGTLHVTATSADATPPPPPADGNNNNSGGGGGAPGLCFLTALAVLAALRRFK